MSKLKKTSSSFPPLQRLILLHLAENEPQTMNQTSKKISKDYKATNNAFKSLKKKKLIEKAYSEPYRGQNYEHYWLTEEGMITALMQQTSPETLLTQTKILYPNNKTIHLFLEIAPLIHPEVMKIALTSVKTKGKLGLAEILTLYLSQPEIAIDEQTLKKFTDTLKKYPEEYSKLKTATQSMIDILGKLITE